MGNTNDSFSVMCIFTACTWMVTDSVAVRVIKMVQMCHIDTESFFQKVTYPQLNTEKYTIASKNINYNYNTKNGYIYFIHIYKLDHYKYL